MGDEFKYFEGQMASLQEKCLRLKHLETQKRKFDTDRYELKVRLDRMIRQDREEREERERKGSRKGIFFRGKDSSDRREAFMRELHDLRNR